MAGLLERTITFLGRLVAPAAAPPSSSAAADSAPPGPEDAEPEATDTPPEGKYNELPAFGAPPPDRTYLIDNALTSLEQGTFREAALLVDSMGRDDRVSGVLDALLNAVLAAPVDLEEADESSAAEIAAEECVALWPKMFPVAELRELVKWRKMIGLGVAEMKWDQTPDTWVPSIRKVWHPQFLTWRMSTRSYWLQTLEGPVELRRGDPRWWVCTSGTYDRAFLAGKVRSLAKPWMIRQWTYRDWARWCEIHGHPIKLLITPAEADERKKKALAGQLANMGSETTMAVPWGSEGNRWDVQLREAVALGFQGFEMLLGKVDVSIAVDLVGQNLTTEVQGGSRAAATVHDQVRDDVFVYEVKELGESERENVLKHWARYNHGDPELAPRPEHEIDPPTDPAAIADTYQKLAGALSALSQAGVDVRAICEDEFNLPMLPEGAQPQMAVPPAIPAGQPPPGSAEGQPPAGKQPAPPPQLNRATFAGPRRHRVGYVRGQRYADGLAGKAQRRAARAMQVDLKAILDEVKAASSPEDLRHRLVTRFRHMNAAGLAEVVEKTKIMAALSGRASLLEDT